MTRTDLLTDIRTRLARGQHILVTGPRGSGKSWMLQQLAGAVDDAIYIPHIGGKKAALLDVLRHLWSADKLADFAYFVEWEDVEKRLRARTIPELAEMVHAHIAGYTVLLDNLHLCTEKTLLEVVAPLLAARVCATANPETPSAARRMGAIANRFHPIELGPLDKAESVAMLWSLLHRSHYAHWRMLQTRVLTSARGRPGAIADMAAQVRSAGGSLATIRSLRHSVADGQRVSLLWPVGITVIAALFASRYLARGLDDPTFYILAAVAYAATFILRPLLYRRR